jgi:ADP-heptose:LPS heptosyltransferase
VTEIKKILVVRVGRAGDMVMITPALNALLQAFPEAEVHLMTSREGRRVMRGYHPHLIRTWLYHRRFPQNLWLKWRLVRELRDQHYMRVYVFEANPHYHRLLAGTAPAVYRIDDRTSGVHYCNRCLELVARSTATPIGKGWVTLPVSDDGLARARTLLAKRGIGSDTLLVGLHPTFSGSSLPVFQDHKGTRHRVWPQESFARLARQLHEKAQAMRLPLRIVIDALPEERALAEPIVSQSGGVVTLLTEPPDFERYKGVLQCLDVMVTPNTGPMHIAAAVGTRVVALFSGWSIDECGPFVPAERFRTLRAEDNDDEERGLAAIPPTKVVETVFDLLPTGRGA